MNKFEAIWFLSCVVITIVTTVTVWHWLSKSSSSDDWLVNGFVSILMGVAASFVRN